MKTGTFVTCRALARAIKRKATGCMNWNALENTINSSGGSVFYLWVSLKGEPHESAENGKTVNVTESLVVEIDPTTGDVIYQNPYLSN